MSRVQEGTRKPTADDLRRLFREAQERREIPEGSTLRGWDDTTGTIRFTSPTFEAAHVEVRPDEWVSREYFEGLPPDRQAQLREIGTESFAAATEQERLEWEAAHVELDTGEWVGRDEYEALPPERQEQLKSMGTAAYNEMAEAAVEAFETAHIELSTGEWVNRGDYEALTPEHQAKLNELGTEAFAALLAVERVEWEAEGIELDSGEWVSREYFEGLSAEHQALLKSVGLDEFNRLAQEKWEEFQRLNIQPNPSKDEWVNREWWDALSPEHQARFKEIGFDAWVAEQEALRAEFDAVFAQPNPDREEWLLRERWDALSTTDQTRIKEIGITAWNQEQADKYLEIKTDVWVLRTEWEALSYAQQEQVKETGYYAPTQSLLCFYMNDAQLADYLTEIRMTQAEWEESNATVLLDSGGRLWVSKTEWGILVDYQREEFLASWRPLGDQRHADGHYTPQIKRIIVSDPDDPPEMVVMTHEGDVTVSAGGVLQSTSEAIEGQKMVITSPHEEFDVVDSPESLAAWPDDFVEVEDGVWLSRADWEKIPPEELARIQEIGYTAWSGEFAAAVEALENWGELTAVQQQEFGPMLLDTLRRLGEDIPPEAVFSAVIDGQVAYEIPTLPTEITTMGFEGELAPHQINVEEAAEVAEELQRMGFAHLRGDGEWEYDLTAAVLQGYDPGRLLLAFGPAAVEQAQRAVSAMRGIEAAGGSPSIALMYQHTTPEEIEALFGEEGAASYIATQKAWEGADQVKQEAAWYNLPARTVATMTTMGILLAASAEHFGTRNVAPLQAKGQALLDKMPEDAGTLAMVAGQVWRVPGYFLSGTLMSMMGTTATLSFLARIPEHIDDPDYLNSFKSAVTQGYVGLYKEVLRDPVKGLSELGGLIVGPVGLLKLVRALGVSLSPHYMPNYAARFTYSTGKLPTTQGDVAAAIKAGKLTEVQIANALTRVINRAMLNPTVTATARLGHSNIKVYIHPTPAAKWMGSALWNAATDRARYKGLSFGVDVKGSEPAAFFSYQVAPRFAMMSASGKAATSPCLNLVYTKAGQLLPYPSSIQHASSLAKMRLLGFKYLGGGKAKPGAYGPIKTYRMKGVGPTFESEALLPNGMTLYRVPNLRTRILGAAAGEFVTTVDGWVLPIYRWAELGAKVPKVGVAQLAAIRAASVLHGLKVLFGKRGLGTQAGYVTYETLRRQFELAGRAAAAGLKGGAARTAYNTAVDRTMVGHLESVYKTAGATEAERRWADNAEVYERAYLENVARLEARVTNYEIPRDALRSNYSRNVVRVELDRDAIVRRADAFDREMLRLIRERRPSPRAADRVPERRPPPRVAVTDLRVPDRRRPDAVAGIDPRIPARRRPDRPDSRRLERPDRVDRTDLRRLERPERPDLRRLERPDRVDRTDLRRLERPERPDRTDLRRLERPERPERPERRDPRITTPRIPRVPPPEESAPRRRGEAPERGTITWKGGAVWKNIPYPYTDKKPRTTRKPLPGTKNTHLRTPEETIQVIGDPRGVPETVSVDLGVTDVFITGKGTKIRFGGGGRKTIVGERIPVPEKGMSVPKQTGSPLELTGDVLAPLTGKRTARGKAQPKRLSHYDYMTTLRGFTP